MSKEHTTIVGTIEDITYINEDNGYSIFVIEQNGEPLTCVGTIPYICVGEQIELIGEYVIHPQYGRQFRAIDASRTMPKSTASILKYLSSGSIKGVGPATAQSIVSRFADKSLEIIEKDPLLLSTIKGISPEKAKKIQEEYLKQYGIREVMLSLSDFNITSSEAIKIFKKFGATSLDKIKQNPYMLCSSINGFSFVRADEIAARLDTSVDDTFRTQAGIEYVLKHNLKNGHTCLPADKLIQTSAMMLSIDIDVCENELYAMERAGVVQKEILGEKEFVFLPDLHKAEKYCANRLTLMKSVPPKEIPVTSSRLEQVERETGVLYDKTQREAITTALVSGMLVLTGGPGTGKTTTLNAIIKLLEESGATVLLAAPTGRAAKRMSELTGREAKTIHRLLEVEWGENDKQYFNKNERNPLDADCVVVDELSMMDIVLFEALLRAIPASCRLILVGDVDQLPSVGAGNVLNDIIESGKVSVVRLTKVFRQAQQSFIVTNAHRIIAGQMPEVSGADGDFFVIDDKNPDKLVASLYCERLPNAYGYNADNIQVLCPSRKRKTGTININNLLQSVINPPCKMTKREIERKGFVLREGDKVMQVRNNYDIIWTKDNGEEGMGVFNGDIGVLEKVDKITNTLTVRFDDKTAVFAGEEIEDLSLSYATTVHKSQGSEFDCVILPVCDIPPQLKYRNLLYTAVTRAKKLLIIIGKPTDIKQMIDNNKKTKRYTAFKYFLDSTNFI